MHVVPLATGVSIPQELQSLKFKAMVMEVNQQVKCCNWLVTCAFSV